jgi:hypothetical protein
MTRSPLIVPSYRARTCLRLRASRPSRTHVALAAAHRPGGTAAFLQQLARDNTQLFANALFSLPVRRDREGGVVVDVPLPVFKLPRCALLLSMPVPCACACACTCVCA